MRTARLPLLAAVLGLALSAACRPAAAPAPVDPTGEASFVMAFYGGVAGAPIPVGHVWLRVHGTPDRGGSYDRWIEATRGSDGAYRLMLYQVPVGGYFVHGRAYATSRGAVDPTDGAAAPPEFATVADVPVRVDAGAAVPVALVLQQTAPPASDQNVAPVVNGLVASSLYLDSTAPAERLTLAAFASDADSPSFTYALSASYSPPLGGLPPGVFTPAAGTFPGGGSLAATFDPPAGYAGLVTITLAVSDGFATSSVSILVDVRPTNGHGTVLVSADVNNYPDVRSISVAQGQLLPSGSTSVTVDAVDPDGDALGYQWANDCGGTFLDGNLATATFVAPATAGTCRLTVTVRDARNGVNDGSWVELVVKAAPTAYQPSFVVVAQTPTTPADNADVLFYVLAEDPATHAVLANGDVVPNDAGAGGTFTSLGWIGGAGAYGWRWTPPAVCPNPNPTATTFPFQITFTATKTNADPTLDTSASFTFNVTMACTVRP